MTEMAKLSEYLSAFSSPNNSLFFQRGDFPSECVYVLPSQTRPPPEVLSLFVAHHNGGGAGAGDDHDKIPPLDSSSEFGVQDGEHFGC